jgi:surface antigen
MLFKKGLMPKVFIFLTLFLAVGCSTTATSAKYLQCVPYARDKSGIQIYGDAHTWWNSAKKRKYPRGHAPKIGSVLVLAKTRHLKFGHIAVVKKILDNRNIVVSHANWGSDFFGRGLIYDAMPVKDVSKNNDWSKVKFLIPEAKSYGFTYPASGFVYNKRS